MSIEPDENGPAAEVAPPPIPDGSEGGAPAGASGAPAATLTEPDTDLDTELGGLVDEGEPQPRYAFLRHWIFGADPVFGGIGLSALVLMILYYTVHFGHLTSDIHRGYGTSSFDIGLYDQGLWLMSRFHAPYITQMGRDLFGDHAQFMLVTLVPLYWFGANAATLLWVQALLMASGAIPVYMLSMRRLKSPLYATIFAAVFLLHPALAQTNLENYHPDSFLIPIVGFLLYAAIENKARMFWIFAILALLCKEDAALVVLPIAIWFTFRRNKKLGAIVAGGAIVYAYVATNVIMKSFTGVATLNTWRIPFTQCAPGKVCSMTSQVADFFKFTLKKPADVVKYIIKSDAPNGRPFYVWQMIAPTGLLFLVQPEIALTMILVLGANVISTFGYQHQIAYHYSMVILPSIAMGTVWAVSKLKKPRWRAIAVSIVALSALWSAYLWGPLPFALHHDIPHWSPSAPQVAAINEVKAKLPPNAVVSAYYSFAPHIDHRVHVYMWPNPFHAVYWNTFRQEGQRLPQADTVEYLFLPRDLGDHSDVFDSIKDQFQVVAESSNAVLYKRIHG